MATLKILIVGDDPDTTYIREFMENAGHRITGIAKDYREAMMLVKAVPPDLAIIDIALGSLPEGGIMAAQRILAEHWMPFIYLNSHTDPAILEKPGQPLPAAFLLRPLRAGELIMQAELACKHFAERSMPYVHNEETFYLPVDNGHEKIKTAEVLYLEAKGACVNVYLSKRANPRMIGTNLGSLTPYFTSPNFYRLSRSLFVNLDHLRRIERTQIFMGDDKMPVGISEANRKELLRRLNVIRTR